MIPHPARETLEYVCQHDGCGWVILDGPEWGVPTCPSHGDPMTSTGERRPR